ncbi:MAG: hypothetical protein HYS65_02525 [Betaproteobacteria bacterium]|nr:hypothetical protein [Betaproteobacteria bacterium]MBI2224091.1 hypothetical protein [Betaproteobacteria bacterium]
MKIIRILLPALLLALATNPAHAQSKDQSGKSRGTGDNVRQADPLPTQSDTAADQARRQKDADQRAHAERFPPKPSAAPPAPSKSSSSSDKGK